MYLPLNFRLPMMERSLQASRDASREQQSNTGSGASLSHNSAFKNTQSSKTATDEIKSPEPLPPISTLRTEGQPHLATRFPYAKPFCGPTPSAHAPTQHPLMNGLAHAQASPPFPAHQPALPPASLAALTPFGAAAAAAAHSHAVSHHPAFSLPMGLPSFLPGAHTLSNAQLQQMMVADGGFVAQYLNSCDPISRAALMELTRMGHYPLGKKLFGCPQCRYITDRKNNLKRHIATMHQDCDKVLECCGLVFKNKAALRDHVLYFHSNGYMCRFCGRNFCRKALLKRHLTVHSGQKDFSCDQCDYATSHKSNLERHRKVHERQGEGSDDNSCDGESPEKLHRRDVSDVGSPSMTSPLGSPINMRNTLAEMNSLMQSTNALHAHARHLDFSKHFGIGSSHASFTAVQKLKDKNENEATEADDSCLIDLEDEFELNNINVVDIDV